MPADVPDFVGLRKRLSEAEVDFVLIGGLAMIVHGSSANTRDLDVMYRRTREQADRIVRALRDVQPRPQGWTEDLPFVWDGSSVLNTPILTSTTEAGDVDLLWEAAGSGGYDHLKACATAQEFGGVPVFVASESDLLNS